MYPNMLRIGFRKFNNFRMISYEALCIHVTTNTNYFADHSLSLLHPMMIPVSLFVWGVWSSYYRSFCDSRSNILHSRANCSPPVAVNLKTDLNASFIRFAKVRYTNPHCRHSVLTKGLGVTIHSLVLNISAKAVGLSIILDISATYKKHFDSLGLKQPTPVRNKRTVSRINADG